MEISMWNITVVLVVLVPLIVVVGIVAYFIARKKSGAAP